MTNPLDSTIRLIRSSTTLTLRRQRPHGTQFLTVYRWGRPRRKTGLVTDYFIAIGYTRIDEDGDQPYSRTYATGPSPYGSHGIAELCLQDMRDDLGAGCNCQEDDE